MTNGEALPIALAIVGRRRANANDREARRKRKVKATLSTLGALRVRLAAICDAAAEAAARGAAAASGGGVGSDYGGTAGTDARAAFLLQAVCDAKEEEAEVEEEEEEEKASFRFLKTVRAFRLAKLTTAANDDARKRPGGKAGQQRKHQHGLNNNNNNNNRRSTTAAASAARAGAVVRSVEDVSDAFAAFELLSEVLGEEELSRPLRPLRPLRPFTLRLKPTSSIALVIHSSVVSSLCLHSVTTNVRLSIHHHHIYI